MFIGRKHELDSINVEITAPRASLVVVYGRRRVGKSTLLQEATRGRQQVFYQATRVGSSLNLEAFKGEAQKSLGGDPLLAGLEDWLGILHYLAQAAERTNGLIVILDEFPYLVDVDPALPSVIQKFWDSGVAQKGCLKLVLCGSLIAQMEELLAEKNPLYGRKTMALDVGPLPLRDAAGFFPHHTAEERIIAHAIFGGVPFYLQLCDADSSIEDNVVHLLLGSAAPLVDEPTYLLQSELRDVQRYASILAAIADGCTKSAEIIGRVREISDSRALSPYLEKLSRMRLIRVARSMDASERERDRRYLIADPLMAFWYRFVRPNLSSAMRGFGRDIYRHQVAPHLDDYLGGAFEEICREHVRRHIQEKSSVPAQKVGQIWGADYDIDVAGRLLDGSMIYGECKWWGDLVGEGVLDTLIERADKTEFGRGVDRRRFLLYARKGFTNGVHIRASGDPRIILYTPDILLAAPPAPGRSKQGPRSARRLKARSSGAPSSRSRRVRRK